MANEVWLHGYPKFKSDIEAIVHLLKCGLTSKEIRNKMPKVTAQKIYNAKRKIDGETKNKI